MDRTSEYLKMVNPGSNHVYEKPEERFYHTLYNDIVHLTTKLDRTNSYKNILSLEEDIASLEAKTNNILDSIELNGSTDMQMHFQGIKQILNSKLLKLSKKLTRNKSEANFSGIELEPEKPKNFKNTNQNMVLEQENRNIMQNQSYDQAKKQLLKIEQIQKTINEHLVLQDERIDDVCKLTGQTSEIYSKISEGEDFSSGSFFRRAGSILLLCLSFVLLFLHFFYGKR